MGYCVVVRGKMIILKAIFLLVALVGMILLLLSVRELNRPVETDDRELSDRMQSDAEREERPITTRSVFHDFLGRNPGK